MRNGSASESEETGATHLAPLSIVPENEYWQEVVERGGSFACRKVGVPASLTTIGPVAESAPETPAPAGSPVPPIVAPQESSRLVGAMGYAQFVNVKEFSEALGVNEKTVYGMIKRKELLASKVGRILRIPVAELERLGNGSRLDEPPKAAKEVSKKVAQ